MNTKIAGRARELIQQLRARTVLINHGHGNVEDIADEECNEAADALEAWFDALTYVADNTYCGREDQWHFKPGYDPQVVLDALAYGEE